MNKKTVIGLSGKLQVGKSTTANILWSKFYNDFEIFGFAHAVKKECSETYIYPNEWNYTKEGKEEVVNHDSLPKKNMTVREILQWHGTDLRRNQNENYWVDVIEDIYNNTEKGLIIDDVRFINEAEFVLNNGKLFRIDIPGLNTGDHRSEIELDDYEYFTKRLKTDTNNQYFSLINANVIYNIIKEELNI